MKRKYFLVLGGLFWLCQARLGFCQTAEERAGARAAADQGYDAFQRGEWESALDLFGRAESLVHSPMHLLYVARSNARLNRWIEAQEAYLRVVRQPLPAGTPAALLQAQQEAARELAALEPQIPFVSIEVEGVSASDALEVKQDGRALPPALIGVAHPLNPGSHTWQARSGSRQSALETRNVEPGSKLSLKLSLPEAEIELIPQKPAPVAGPPAPTAVAPVAPAATSATSATSASNGPSPWLYVGVGVAAAGIGVGTGFLIQKGHIEDQIRRTCSKEDGCLATRENLDRKSDADRAGLISAIAFTAGGVGLAGAIALWLLAPDAAAAPEAEGTGSGVQLWLGWNSAGVRSSF
jgi:hypothetical protein